MSPALPMDPSLVEVLVAVRARVDHLRAANEAAPEDLTEGWHHCDGIGVATLDQVIDGATGNDPAHRPVTASLLAQSYAHRVGAVSLAAYAVGLPWPSPAASATAVRFAGGRAKALCFRSGALGHPDDVDGLAEQLFASQLVPFLGTLRRSQRLGEKLLWANVAASSASAFRSVEGAARDRGDGEERSAIRARAARFFDRSPWLEGTGHYEADTPDWLWQRSACCLWYQTSGGRTCEGCSLGRAGGAGVTVSGRREARQ